MGVLAQVLRGVPKPTDPNLLVGSDHFDDAGVYRLDDDTAIVTTVDFFPPLVDDAYQFGRIAAANSLSDIYAMGGRPICALNIVGFPDQELSFEVLGEILRGGAERVAAAGAVVAGGHSVRDSEIKFGLAVTGVIHPDRILTNAGARVGDVLILTKPLGSGSLTTAAKQGKINQADLAEAIEVMTDLNAAACEAAIAVGVNCESGVHAATDITGFGLIGHAHELAEASGVTIEIDAKAVPLMKRVLELAAMGVVTRAAKSNFEYIGSRFENRGADETLVKVLADAQTSGGLLLSVSSDRADALLQGLIRRQTRAAVVVGRAVESSKQTVVAL
jgi:selenide,water dikinase